MVEIAGGSGKDMVKVGLWRGDAITGGVATGVVILSNKTCSYV